MFDIGVNIHEYEIIQEDARVVTVNVNEPKMRDNPELVAKSSAHLQSLLQGVLDSRLDMSFNVVDSIPNTGNDDPIRRNFR